MDAHGLDVPPPLEALPHRHARLVPRLVAPDAPLGVQPLLQVAGGDQVELFLFWLGSEEEGAGVGQEDERPPRGEAGGQPAWRQRPHTVNPQHSAACMGTPSSSTQCHAPRVTQNPSRAPSPQSTPPAAPAPRQRPPRSPAGATGVARAAVRARAQGEPPRVLQAAESRCYRHRHRRMDAAPSSPPHPPHAALGTAPGPPAGCGTAPSAAWPPRHWGLAWHPPRPLPPETPEPPMAPQPLPLLPLPLLQRMRPGRGGVPAWQSPPRALGPRTPWLQAPCA